MGAYGTPEHLPGDNEEPEYQYGYNQPYKNGFARTALKPWQKVLLVIYLCVTIFFGFIMFVSVSSWKNKTVGIILAAVYILSSLLFVKRVKLHKMSWPLILCSVILFFAFFSCAPVSSSPQAVSYVPQQSGNTQSSISATAPNSKANVAASPKSSTPGNMVAQYEKQCSNYTYKKIARNPNNYKGKLAKFTGQVMQVEDDGSGSEFILLNVTKNEYGTWSDSIYVEYSPKSADESRILEDDIITVYGQLGGIKSYTAVLGNEISVPYLKVQYVKILPESNSSK